MPVEGAVESELLRNFRRIWLEGNAHFEAGDFEAAWAGVPEDIELEPVRDFPGGTIRGRDGVVDFVRGMRESFPDWRGEPLSFVEPVPGRIVVHLRMSGSGRATGLQAAGDLWQLWEFEGNVPRRIREFRTREEADAAIEEARG